MSEEQVQSSEALREAGYVGVGTVGEIPQVMPKKVHVSGRSVLLCRTSEGEVRALDELCPHKMESMAYGVVFEDRLICPHHQYSFDLQTGQSSMRRCPPATTYAVAVSASGEVFVKV